MLASVLDRVEDVSEVPGCFGRTYLGHTIRLSDVPASIAGIAVHKLVEHAGVRVLARSFWDTPRGTPGLVAHLTV